MIRDGVDFVSTRQFTVISLLRINLLERLEALEKVIGANANVGIRKKPPKAPKLSKNQPFTSSKYALKLNNLVNVVVFSEDYMVANDDIKQR